MFAILVAIMLVGAVMTMAPTMVAVTVIETKEATL